jgi:hypothetical protein
MPYGKSYQLTRRQFPLHLAHAMTYNKSQSQTTVHNSFEGNISIDPSQWLAEISQQ